MKKTTLMSVAYSFLGGLMFHIWCLVYQQKNGTISAANFALNLDVISMVTLVIMAILLMAPIPLVQPPNERFHKYYLPVVRFLLIFAGVAFASLAVRWIDSLAYGAGILFGLLSIGFLYCAPQMIHESQRPSKA